MKIVKIISKYLSVAFVLAIVLLPLYWIFISSLKSTPELINPQPTFYPRTVTWEHYLNLFRQADFLKFFLNSTYVALGSTIITIFLGSLAAYSIYRCKYRARRTFFRLFLSSYIFPRVLLLIPLYVTFTHLRIIDTIVSLIVINVTVNAPLGVWILRAFFTSVPVELEDAALVDGASRLQILFRIFFPIVTPGIGALAINSFLLSWTEYLFASIFIVSEKSKTLPVGMAYFLQQYYIDWGVLMAGSILIALPPIIFFAFAGKYFVKGLAAGAIR